MATKPRASTTIIMAVLVPTSPLPVAGSGCVTVVAVGSGVEVATSTVGASVTVGWAVATAVVVVASTVAAAVTVARAVPVNSTD